MSTIKSTEEARTTLVEHDFIHGTYCNDSELNAGIIKAAAAIQAAEATGIKHMTLLTQDLRDAVEYLLGEIAQQRESNPI